jgi:hypothetical protein
MQAQLGEMLGMSLVSVNRNLQALRQTKAADHRAGKLEQIPVDFTHSLHA